MQAGWFTNHVFGLWRVAWRIVHCTGFFSGMVFAVMYPDGSSRSTARDGSRGDMSRMVRSGQTGHIKWDLSGMVLSV